MKLEQKQIPSSKGNVSAVFHYPDKPSGWLAVLCPGFLDNKDYNGLVELANVLCEKGFTVVRFDPTGTWGSGGDIADYTITQYLEDVGRVVDYALANKSYKNILIGGHSRGGHIAIEYANFDSRISLVLGIMPPNGVIDDGLRKSWETTGYRLETKDVPGKSGEAREFRVPFSYQLDNERHDVLVNVKKLTIPVILIAGGDDELNTPEEINELAENTSGPKKFAVIPGVGHDYRLNLEQAELVNEKILELLEEYL